MADGAAGRDTSAVITLWLVRSLGQRPRMTRTRPELDMFGTFELGLVSVRTGCLPSSISLSPNHGPSVPGMTDLACVQLPQRVGELLSLTLMGTLGGLWPPSPSPSLVFAGFPLSYPTKQPGSLLKPWALMLPPTKAARRPSVHNNGARTLALWRFDELTPRAGSWKEASTVVQAALLA